MTKRPGLNCLAIVVLAALPLPILTIAGAPDDGRAEGEGAAQAPALRRPEWQVGDRWTLMTQTEAVQRRADAPLRRAARVRWEFHVAGIEELAGTPCYRIDIKCLAKGRFRPQTTLWCEKQTLFLRQFRTQVAVAGKLRTIQESYDPPTGRTAPVVVPLPALPVGLPVFDKPGAKTAGPDTATYRYVSQPLPAGSKDLGDLVRFAHEVKQQVGKPTAKSLENLPRSKSPEKGPITEVTLSAPHRTVTQLWREGAPWPVYVNNGPTQAWLVSERNEPDR
jgi:hypothetical protein